MLSDRVTRCRYIRRNIEPCTGEAADPNADILLCQKHLARAVTLIRHTAVQRLARQKPATNLKGKP